MCRLFTVRECRQAPLEPRDGRPPRSILEPRRRRRGRARRGRAERVVRRQPARTAPQQMVRDRRRARRHRRAHRRALRRSCRVVLCRRTPRRGSPRARGVAAHAARRARRRRTARPILATHRARRSAAAWRWLARRHRRRPGGVRCGRPARDGAVPRDVGPSFAGERTEARGVNHRSPAPLTPHTLSNPPATAHRASSRVLAHADAPRRRRPRRKRDPRRPPPMPRARRRASDGTD